MRDCPVVLDEHSPLAGGAPGTFVYVFVGQPEENLQISQERGRSRRSARLAMSENKRHQFGSPTASSVKTLRFVSALSMQCLPTTVGRDWPLSSRRATRHRPKHDECYTSVFRVARRLSTAAHSEPPQPRCLRGKRWPRVQALGHTALRLGQPFERPTTMIASGPLPPGKPRHQRSEIGHD